MTALALALALQDAPTLVDFETESAAWEVSLTGEGPPAAWKRVEDPSATSGRFVLAPSNPDRTDYRFVMAVCPRARAESGVLWVRFKPLDGAVDRAGGLVWRYRDAKNYYVARANALEGNLRIYKVVDGKRIQLASQKTEVAAGIWHTLVARFEGAKHSVSMDGRDALEVEDGEFVREGAVGLWTKSDSVTHFDDLTLAPSTESLEAEWLALFLLGDPRQGFHESRRISGRKEIDLRRIAETVREPSDWQRSVVRGALELRSGDREAAARTFSAVLASRPGCHEALLGRARALRSIRDAELALALHPKSTRALVLLGQLHLSEMRVEEALLLADRALAIDASCVTAALLRGSARLAAGDAGAAIEEYDRAARLDPEEPRAHYNRSLAWEKKGNHDRAMKDAERAAELAPELPDPRHQMGRLFTFQPDYDAAEREFKRALEIDPRYAKSVIGLGWLEAHRGELEEAIRHYDRAIQIDPSIADGWALRGNAKWKLKRVEASIEDYSKAIEINPRLAIAWANRGLALASQESYARAVKDFERALELDPALRATIGGDLRRAREELWKQEY
jgi:tetratricopeptide (TPR) repeat protein